MVRRSGDRLRTTARGGNARPALVVATVVLVGGGILVSLLILRNVARQSEPAAESTVEQALPPPAPPALTAVEIPAITGRETAADKLTAKQPAASDAWSTEVLTDQLLARLGQLSDLMSAGDFSAAQHAALLADDFRSTALRPLPLSETCADGLLTVHRPTQPVEQESIATPTDVAHWCQALQQLLAPLEGASPPRIKFKLYQIDVTQRTAMTQLFYEASNVHARKCTQQNARWTCEWQLSTADGTPTSTLR